MHEGHKVRYKKKFLYMALRASQMVAASWYRILNCKVNNELFFPKCIIELMSLIIHKWWKKPHGKGKLKLAMSRGKRIQTYVRFGMKAQLMVDGIFDPHLGLKAP
jgi:hypothetical protein